MKDFLNNDLEVGDEIVCIERDYKNLVKAKIIKITGKTISVEYIRRAYPGIERTTQVKRFSDQVVKI